MDGDHFRRAVTVGVAIGMAAAAQAAWFLAGSGWPVPVVACPVLTTGWWWAARGIRRDEA